MNQTCEPKAPVRVPSEEPLLSCGRPQSIDRANASSLLFTEDLSNYLSSNKVKVSTVVAWVVIIYSSYLCVLDDFISPEANEGFYLNYSEVHVQWTLVILTSSIEDPMTIVAHISQNGDRIIQVCCGHILFLANTIFVIKSISVQLTPLLAFTALKSD